MRQHTWTIETDEPNEPNLSSIFPGKNTLVSQPDGSILRTYVTYDPITNEQHNFLIPSIPWPKGVHGMSVASVEMVDPNIMTKQEREYLVTAFKGIAQQFETIEHQLQDLEDLYPGLHLVSISLNARQGQEEGEKLSEYIEVADGVQWKQKG